MVPMDRVSERSRASAIGAGNGVPRELSRRGGAGTCTARVPAQGARDTEGERCLGGLVRHSPQICRHLQ